MAEHYIIGVDFGSESARGVLVNIRSGAVEAIHTCAYRHGILSASLWDGTPLPPFWSLQDARDYTECAEVILAELGRGRIVRSIGVGFTASTPMPTRGDGMPLSILHPAEPHAYAKLWKHGSAQPWADAISAAGGDHLRDVGGRLSANSLIAKAAEMAQDAPRLWAEAERFIEAGDWLVWQLTGVEVRSYAFATYKALYRPDTGYPDDLVPHLAGKLARPEPVGTRAGRLTADWRLRTGILGDPVVAVAVIDSHVVMPAVGAVLSGTLVGALGTSAVFLLLDGQAHPLPAGIEGVALDATLPGLRCFEAGQAGFGDALAWFVRAFPLAEGLEENFARYNAAASRLTAGETRLVALDWFNGNRVPYGDAQLSGLFAGITLRTTGIDLYRALLESLCFGARSIMDLLLEGGAPVERVVLTSGLSLNNTLLMQLMADILGREIHVPQTPHLTAIGAAIHGAVGAGVVADYAEAAERFGAADHLVYAPDATARDVYATIYGAYRALGDNPANRAAMNALSALKR